MSQKTSWGNRISGKPLKENEHSILNISVKEASPKGSWKNASGDYKLNVRFDYLNLVTFFSKGDYLKLLKEHIEEVEKDWEKFKLEYTNLIKQQKMTDNDIKKEVINRIEAMRDSFCKKCKKETAKYIGAEILSKELYCEKCLKKIIDIGVDLHNLA